MLSAAPIESQIQASELDKDAFPSHAPLDRSMWQSEVPERLSSSCARDRSVPFASPHVGTTAGAARPLATICAALSSKGFRSLSLPQAFVPALPQITLLATRNFPFFPSLFKGELYRNLRIFKYSTTHIGRAQRSHFQEIYCYSEL